MKSTVDNEQPVTQTPAPPVNFGNPQPKGNRDPKKAYDRGAGKIGLGEVAAGEVKQYSADEIRAFESDSLNRHS